MAVFDRVLRNSTSLIISSVIGRGLAFFAVLMAARYLGADGYGMISFALALCGVFNVVADLGFHLVIVKDVARDNSLAIPYIRKVIFIKVFLVMAAFALIYCTAVIIGRSDQSLTVILLVAIYIIINGFSQVAVAFLKAFEKMYLVAIVEVLLYLLLLGGFGWAIWAGLRVTAFAYSYVFAALVVLAFSWISLGRVIRLHPDAMKPSTTVISSAVLIKSAIPFAVIFAMNMIFFYSDSLMLGIFREDRDVGLYGVAYRSALFLSFITWAMNTSLLPVLSRMYGEGEIAVGQIAGRYFRYIMMAAIPIGVGGTVLSGEAMVLVFGEKFMEAGPILSILVWSLVFMFMRAPFVNLFESTDRQSIVSRAFIYCVAFNIAVNLILIPKYGMVGAAISTVIADSMIFSFLAFKGITSGLYVSVHGVRQQILKVIALSAVMGILCYYSLRFGVIIAFIVAVVSYTIMLLLSKTLKGSDLNVLRKAFLK